MRSRLGNSLRNALTAAFLFSCIAPCALANEKEPQPPYVIPLDESSERVTQAKGELLAALKSLVPPAKRGEIVEKAESPYVLYGDLFGNRKSYALVELSERVGLGFATWDGKEWQPRGLWDISPIWRPKGWKSNDDDYLPCEPAEKPFWIKELSGDRVNEIVVAGSVWRDYQKFHLFRFDAKPGQLQWIADSRAEPEYVRGYLKLFFDSRPRAVWAETRFHRWLKGRIVSVADWWEGVDEDDEDNVECWRAVTYDSRGEKEAEFKIIAGEAEKPNEVIYKVLRNGKPFSEVAIRWKAEGDDSIALAFLFERLTWIPRSLYPGAEESLPAKATLEKLGDIIVTGKPLKR